jgi:hypothetical protein
MASRTFDTVARADRVTMIVTATRAAKSFRPALTGQSLATGCFRAVSLLPVQQIRSHRFHDPTPRSSLITKHWTGKTENS